MPRMTSNAMSESKGTIASSSLIFFTLETRGACLRLRRDAVVRGKSLNVP